MNRSDVVLRCPICGKVFRWSGRIDRAFPFCSTRCKMADLDAWFNEEYRISTPISGVMEDGGGSEGPDGSEEK